MAAWAPLPDPPTHPHQKMLHREKKEIYQRGPNSEVNIRHTNLFFGLYPKDLLERGGGGGRGGARGGICRGDPPPFRNIPNPQGTEKILENEQLSTWKCHVVGRKQGNSSLNVNSRFPHLTNTQQLQQSGTFTISCQMTIIFLVSRKSELDLPKLEPPSVVGLELDSDDDESMPEWETSHKLSDSASSSTDSESEGTSASETCVFRRLVPLSLRLPRKLRNRVVFRNSAATAQRSYSAHGAQGAQGKWSTGGATCTQFMSCAEGAENFCPMAKKSSQTPGF